MTTEPRWRDAVRESFWLDDPRRPEAALSFLVPQRATERPMGESSWVCGFGSQGALIEVLAAIDVNGLARDGTREIRRQEHHGARNFLIDRNPSNRNGLD